MTGRLNSNNSKKNSVLLLFIIIFTETDESQGILNINMER